MTTQTHIRRSTPIHSRQPALALLPVSPLPLPPRPLAMSQIISGLGIAVLAFYIGTRMQKQQPSSSPSTAAAASPSAAAASAASAASSSTPASKAAASRRVVKDDKLKMVLLVRNDLGMGQPETQRAAGDSRRTLSEWSSRTQLTPLSLIFVSIVKARARCALSVATPLWAWSARCSRGLTLIVRPSNRGRRMVR